MKRNSFLLAALLCCLMLIGGAEEAPASRIIYLYVPACGSCAKVEALLDGLGDWVQVDADGGPFASPLRIEKVDLSREPDRAQRLFLQFETPEEDRIAPSVYFGDRYLAGADAVLTLLPDALKSGQALESMPAAGEGIGEEAAGTDARLSAGAAAGAGLVAGLNPCALSMLLLLLGTLLQLERRGIRLAAVFLASKLVTYFLIGALLLGVLQAWNPLWLSFALKSVLSAAGLALMAVNLTDAVRAARGEYGKVKNQLPSALRGKLQGFIRRLAASRHLAGAMVVLGIAVSLGEFLCAGQIYLASLLAWVNTGAADAGKYLLLAAYCVCFLLPSVIVTAAVFGLRQTLKAGDYLRRRMPLIKVLSAAALLLAVLYAWLV